ncbi:hypothetical protein [Nocardia sp. NPDC046763]|uniref:hypothetical protein n=1 Tax=Nocardia sp. NPDC046763 TaxID=3155256 RepID=UPI0033C450C4
MAPAAARWTTGQALDRILQLGLATSDQVAEVTEEYRLGDELDLALLDSCESLPHALVSLMEQLGVGFGVGTDDGVTPGAEADAYQAVLQDAAQCTGGLLTITDVELGPDDEFDMCLLFQCNNEPQRWPIELRGKYFDLMAFVEGIDDLDVPPHVWDSIDTDESDGCDPYDLELRNFYFFGEPGALRLLTTDFGVKLLRHGD